MKLPKTIYVRWEDPGGGEALFLMAAKDARGAAEGLDIGETRVVGEYELVRTKLLSVELKGQ